MFTTQKETLVVLFSIIFLSFHVFANNDFDTAIEQAKSQGLTSIQEAKDGVPYYSAKNLDPVWNEATEGGIVRIDKFSFLNQKNANVTESAFNDKLTFVAFFFSSCAGFCPMLIQNLKDVEQKLKKFGPSIQYLIVSVDPKTDSPKTLLEYSKKMGLGSSWTLLTGPEDVVYSFARDTLLAEAFKLPKSEGQFAHSEHFYVFDRERRLRGVLNGTRLDVPDKAEKLISSLGARP